MILTPTKRRQLTPPSRAPWRREFPDGSVGYAINLAGDVFGIVTADQDAKICANESINADVRIGLTGRGRGKNDDHMTGRGVADAIQYLRWTTDYDTDDGRRRVIIDTLLAEFLAKQWTKGMTLGDLWSRLDQRPADQPGGKNGWQALADVRKALESKPLDFLEKKLKKEQKIC